MNLKALFNRFVIADSSSCGIAVHHQAGVDLLDAESQATDFGVQIGHHRNLAQ